MPRAPRHLSLAFAVALGVAAVPVAVLWWPRPLPSVEEQDAICGKVLAQVVPDATEPPRFLLSEPLRSEEASDDVLASAWTAPHQEEGSDGLLASGWMASCERAASERLLAALCPPNALGDFRPFSASVLAASHVQAVGEHPREGTALAMSRIAFNAWRDRAAVFVRFSNLQVMFSKGLWAYLARGEDGQWQVVAVELAWVS